jgi:hypothetical protein
MATIVDLPVRALITTRACEHTHMHHARANCCTHAHILTASAGANQRNSRASLDGEIDASKHGRCGHCSKLEFSKNRSTPGIRLQQTSTESPNSHINHTGSTYYQRVSGRQSARSRTRSCHGSRRARCACQPAITHARSHTRAITHVHPQPNTINTHQITRTHRF